MLFFIVFYDFSLSQDYFSIRLFVLDGNFLLEFLAFQNFWSALQQHYIHSI
jgi:hypothetical protein